jgi:hypothetical protein
MPTYYRFMRCFCICKPELKRCSRKAMRAAERRSRDALRQGADPDADTTPVRAREVADRWAFD